MRTALAVYLCLVSLSTLAAGPLHVRLDKIIAAKADGPVAPRSDDAEFFRRVQLDFSGIIPKASEVRAFLKNKSPDKRTKFIDQLLARDTFAAHWTDRLTVMLLERQNLGKITKEEWRGYLAKTLKGKPKWDVMAREMIAATGRGEARSAMKFLGAANHHGMTEDIAQLFLGMDLKCAKCHDHPSVDDWKQAHYWGLFTYLNQTKQATNSKDKQTYLVEGLAIKKVEFQSVFETEKENTGPRLPGGKEIEIPTFEKGQEFEKPAADGLPAVPKFRPRELLARDLTAKDNTYFVRNSVNRFWFLMMGRGLVHPLDEVHGKNPPSHPALLDLLAKEFVVHGFDVKWLLREIALSESYQRSSRLPAKAKSVKTASYRTAHPKALTPEQLLNAVLKATGNLEKVYAMKADPNAEKFDRKGYFTGTNLDLPPSLDEIRAVFVQTYGKPPGEAEVDFMPGLNKSLFLMNDKLIIHWLKPHKGNLIERLTKMKTA
ncbi:MAG: DUF1553 domain-containing protein, partial [Verrucomicrobiota bacterium]|nr:DUF1553 domain-containing protein [Verrucomicrobiota bacterium]